MQATVLLLATAAPSWSQPGGTAAPAGGGALIAGSGVIATAPGNSSGTSTFIATNVLQPQTREVKQQSSSSPPLLRQ